MISEERFEKLLADNQNIYWVIDDRIRFLKCSTVPPFWKNKWELYEQVLFETKEEAEEYAKYGNVTRTEKFPYVSWEDFQKQDNIIRFIDKQGNKCKVEGYFSEITGGFIDVVQGGTGLGHSLKYNKKDYLTALDLAVKLFKGE